MRTLAATVVFALACSDSPVDPGPPPPPPPPPPPDPTLTFDIEVRYVAGTVPTEEEQQAIDEAVAIWESVIVGDLPALPVSRPAGMCEQVSIPAMNETVDDLVVWFEFTPMDGPMGIGAFGGVCELRSNFLPAVGSVVFDTDDLPTFGKDRVVHELGHALGFGEVWDDLGLLIDAAKPIHGGPGFLRATEDATISSDRPDDTFGIPNGDPISELLVVGSGMGMWTSGPPDEELRSLVRFDLSNLGFVAPIQGARLGIWDSSAAGADRRLLLSTVDGPWDEATVTWNSQPAASASFIALLIFQTGCPEEGCFVRAGHDIRDIVRDWLSVAVPNHGFFLIGEFPGDPDAGIAIHSRHDPDVEKRPALYIQPSTHFAGPNAIAAYDAAGGAGSSYPKVPVENRLLTHTESADGHWHPIVMIADYMATQGGTKMSAITIGAMEDLGYTVDYSVADPVLIDPAALDPF